MKFHHDFHHQAYINNLNKAMAGKDAASLVSLMPGAKAAKLNNAGGGHYNHVSVVAPPFFSLSPTAHNINTSLTHPPTHSSRARSASSGPSWARARAASRRACSARR